MEAMVLKAPHASLELLNVADPHAGPGQVVGEGRCMRRLSHRPARRRRRAAARALARNSRPRDRRNGGRDRCGVDSFARGDRVGVPWLAWTCGACDYCRAGRENLCDNARFTGYTVDGGYARVRGRRPSILLRHARRDAGRGARSLAVCGAHRLPRTARRRARLAGSASTASARPRTSWRRSRASGDRKCSRSPGRATPRRRHSPVRSVRSGRARATRRRHVRSTRPSSSRRSAACCRSPCATSRRAEPWCARAST